MLSAGTRGSSEGLTQFWGKSTPTLSHVVVVGTLSLSPREPLLLVQAMAGKVSDRPRQKPQSLFHLNLELPSHHFCHILCIRSESASSAYIRGGDYIGHDYPEVGMIPCQEEKGWGCLRGCSEVIRLAQKSCLLSISEIWILSHRKGHSLWADRGVKEDFKERRVLLY